MNKFSSIFGQILQLFSKREFYEAVQETGAEKGAVTSHIILIPISYERLHLSETTDRKLPWLPVSCFSDDLGRGNANVFGRHHPALFMSCREQSSFGEEVCPSEQSP